MTDTTKDTPTSHNSFVHTSEASNEQALAQQAIVQSWKLSRDFLLHLSPESILGDRKIKEYIITGTPIISINKLNSNTGTIMVTKTYHIPISNLGSMLDGEQAGLFIQEIEHIEKEMGLNKGSLYIRNATFEN